MTTSHATESDTPRADWNTALPAWLASIHRVPSRSCLSKFRKWCEAEGYGTVPGGEGTALALGQCISALKWAERAGGGPVDLPKLRAQYRAHLKAVAAEKQAAHDAFVQAAAEKTNNMLFAGEDTTHVCTGTLAECLRHVGSLDHLEKDECTGRGCWAIVTANGEELMSGEF